MIRSWFNDSCVVPISTAPEALRWVGALTWQCIRGGGRGPLMEIMQVMIPFEWPSTKRLVQGLGTTVETSMSSWPTVAPDPHTCVAVSVVLQCVLACLCLPTSPLPSLPLKLSLAGAINLLRFNTWGTNASYGAISGISASQQKI